MTRAFNTTKMLDRIAARHGRELIEHGIGFKYVCDYMLEREIVMGGEESGGIGFQRHLPERDGLLNALLLANVMAEEGKTLGQLVADLQAEYGEHHYGRIDLHIPDAVIRRLNGAADQAREGRNLCVELIQQIRTLRGVSGAHIMAYRHEESVAEVIERSGVLAGRRPWYPGRDSQEQPGRKIS